MRNYPIRVSFMIFLCVLASFASAAGKRKQQNKSETVVEVKSISPESVYTFSRSVGAGRLVKASSGKVGLVKRTYRLLKEEGKVVGKELVKEQRTEAEPAVYYIGRAGWQTSRGGFERHKVLSMNASAYDPGPQSCGRFARAGRTKLGIKAQFGVAAVDPRVIPLGSLLYVEGYGLAYACDIGGAVKGNKIDLCYPNRSQALQYGRKNVKVHVLKAR